MVDKQFQIANTMKKARTNLIVFYLTAKQTGTERQGKSNGPAEKLKKVLQRQAHA